MASEARGSNDDSLKDRQFDKPEPVSNWPLIQDKVKAVSN